MDAVITYVNGAEARWRKQYNQYAGRDYSETRFRDWGTLPFLLRGIDIYLPFVRRVHLVVSDDSQVPAWVNRSKLHIVRHKDIIPEKLLPTFNSCTIEMFLHRIEGLDEQYIYFNDDMFVVKPSNEGDFFQDGKPRVWCKVHQQPDTTSTYRMQCSAASNLAAKLCGIRPNPEGSYIKPQHAPAPMLRSVNAEIFDRADREILSSITRLRTHRNLNQYLFTDYYWLSGIAVRKPLNYGYITFKNGIDAVANAILNPKRNLLCINDAGCVPEEFSTTKERLLSALESHFPQKSPYEL